MTNPHRQPRPLELSDDIRPLLFKLRKITETTVDMFPAAISTEQIIEVENELGCTFPDSIIALFANHDDALTEQCGVRIESVVDNTLQAHQKGHPKTVVAIGCHPDFHCFYCIPRRPSNLDNPGITEYDNFDGSSNYLTLSEWLSQQLEREIDFNGTDPEVTEEELGNFQPALT